MLTGLQRPVLCSDRVKGPNTSTLSTIYPHHPSPSLTIRTIRTTVNEFFAPCPSLTTLHCSSKVGEHIPPALDTVQRLSQSFPSHPGYKYVKTTKHQPATPPSAPVNFWPHTSSLHSPPTPSLPARMPPSVDCLYLTSSPPPPRSSW